MDACMLHGCVLQNTMSNILRPCLTVAWGEWQLRAVIRKHTCCMMHCCLYRVSVHHMLIYGSRYSAARRRCLHTVHTTNGTIIIQTLLLQKIAQHLLIYNAAQQQSTAISSNQQQSAHIYGISVYVCVKSHFFWWCVASSPAVLY